MRSVTSPTSSPRWKWALIAALVVYAFAFQGSRGLWEPDEGRYTAIACEMVRSGDYLVPAFNDDQPHFAKPPMTYWAVAAALETFGWNQWAARLPNAIAYLGTIWIVFLLAARLAPGRQWLAAVVYATFLVPYMAANVVTTDTILTAWEALAMLGFVLWWQRPDRERVVPWVMWLGFGLAFLTKGPPGMLPLIAAAVTAGVTGGRRDLRRMFDLRGVALWAVLGLGWYAVIIATRPDLFSYFVRDELVGRIATAKHHRNPEWYGAFKVYLPTLAIGTLPWLGIILRPLRHTRRAIRPSWWRELARRDAGFFLLATWVLIPLAIFFVVRSRLPLYVLPLFVPLAVATARLATTERAHRRWFATAVAVWAVLLAGARYGATHIHTHQDARPVAAAIEAAAGATPEEVVFAGVKPWWGVSLYLRAEVERVALAGDDGDAPETLRQELRQDERRVFLVAPAREVAAVEGIARNLGPASVMVGRWGDLAFFDVHPWQEGESTASPTAAGNATPPASR